MTNYCEDSRDISEKKNTLTSCLRVEMIKLCFWAMIEQVISQLDGIPRVKFKLVIKLK